MEGDKSDDKRIPGEIPVPVQQFVGVRLPFGRRSSSNIEIIIIFLNSIFK